MLEQIKEKLAAIKAHPAVTPLTLRKAHALYVNGQCRLLTCARDHFHLAIDDEFKDFNLTIEFKEDVVTIRCSCKAP
ncbi:MAG: hypothetical protein GQ578_06900, partial [Desulfuromonadaceae bacterium]|nr:hypothetical protein [Desulfuromonadaceae bacterium]